MKPITTEAHFVWVSDFAEITPDTQMEKTFASPVGTIFIKANQFGLSQLTLVSDTVAMAPLTQSNLAASKHLLQAEREIAEYFCGERRDFTVALAPKGTEFQTDVWRALTELKYGTTCSYGDIAQRINRPKAVRAVGTANGANSIAIIIPCHRVIGKNGQLTGYAHGLDVKQALLNLEGVKGLTKR